ncbi:TrmH family RNA methyltransferase [Paenibacillus flagellatus]|uniref:rRNA methyltransferase n=1 Tax=Paenibacillus flagellatus TaxID=2211139 RepID=A0A2V5JVT6_9BACL|nr:RNA methyltransferase [Paenibacillus flagellatus]PYI50865.1 rRNA methyltransferase [Paenibacillus flagellatus]
MNRQEPIRSVNNPRVKGWSQLLDKKGRDKRGAYIIEGVHLVQEALRHGAAVETILYSELRGLPDEIGPAAMEGAECIPVSEQVLAKVSDTQTPQAVVAIVEKARLSAESLLERRDGLVVVVDGVQDPGNLGTIVRSADAVGATGVVLGRGTVDLYNPKTVRSTMGSLFHVPVAEADLLPLLAEAKRRGVKLFNASLQASRTCYEADFTGPTWIVLGNEGKGVSPEVAAQVDEHVIIPMKGSAESLNVAMAATVLLFEAMRQRGL